VKITMLMNVRGKTCMRLYQPYWVHHNVVDALAACTLPYGTACDGASRSSGNRRCFLIPAMGHRGAVMQMLQLKGCVPRLPAAQLLLSQSNAHHAMACYGLGCISVCKMMPAAAVDACHTLHGLKVAWQLPGVCSVKRTRVCRPAVVQRHSQAE
jgi:hypothetical protein